MSGRGIAMALRKEKMRGLIIGVLACVMMLAMGCSGCDDVSGGTTDGEDTGLADIGSDVDEIDAGPSDVEEVDGGPDVGQPDTDTGPEAEPCDDEGATRPCGTDVGECEKGTEYCYNGYWTECIGEIGPRAESCNGLDDSCTGVADDGEEMCGESSSPCFGAGSCVDGSCEYEPVVDCSHLDGPCTVGQCDGKFGECIAIPREDGIDCSDGDYCTVDGVCQHGECVSEPRDCSEASDQCNEGVCDSELEACVPSPVSDGSSCDDEMFCTVNTVCSDGECVGSVRSCPSTGNPCTEAVCDLSTDSCEVVPLANDTPCDNGLFCTVNDSCQDGVCQEGQPRNCADAEGSCQTGVCDEATNSCLGDPVADGTACDDGNFCTVNTQCVAGQCSEGQPRDCSDAGDQCNVGVCDEVAGECVPDPVADGTGCDDGQYCTVNNLCIAGSCTSGTPRDCSGLGDQCNDGYCSESAESCLSQPANVGQSCDDDLYCTINTACTSDGYCEGDPRDCSYLDEECQYGVCDEGAEACVSENEPDGTGCDDDLYCTVDNACVAGVCEGNPRDCSGLEDDECLVDAQCDEAAQSCVATDICDPCEELPTADPGQEQEVAPNTLVELDGTGSSDPNGQDLSYEWTVESRPSGSSSNFDDPTSATPTIMGDVAGEFVICLTVTNEDDCESESECVNVTVVPDMDLHIELTWDPDVDYDLHYRAPGYPWFDRETGPPGQTADCGDPNHQAGDVWFCVRNPDWGGGDGGEPDGDPINDPILDIDSWHGDEPENINQEELFDGEGFRIGVHLWDDYGNEPTEARVRVYVSGQLVFEEFHTISCGQMWEVADIDVSNGGTQVDVTSLNQQVIDANHPDMGLSLDGC